jgi:diguanylate cyclase (GGDEF)-like protein/PAS domain S-box-containing protein
MGTNPYKTVLLIENDFEQARVIREMFDDQASHSFNLTHVESLKEAEAFIAAHPVEIVVLDLGLTDSEGLAAVRRTRIAAPHASIVLLSSPDDEPKAIQAIHEGAQDYLIKGQIEPRKLLRALGNAVERTANEGVLITEKERAETTLNSIADALICTDMAGNITFCNPVASGMMGWPLKDQVGRPLTEVFRLVDATTRKTILDPMAKAASENLTGNLPLNCVLIGRDGQEVYIEDSVAPIHDGEGKVTGAVIVFRDVSAARAQLEQMAHLAEHDALTGLPNRLLFCDRVSQALTLARRHGRLAAVLFLDLNEFKFINDSLGHAAGDESLKSVANCLLNCVRTPDTVSRLGGDEFVVLLQDLHRPEDAAASARRMLQAVSEIQFADHRELHVTASIGISVFPADGLDAETLIRNADSAMYRAKKTGCQSFQFFGRDIDVFTDRHESIEKGLQLALARNELTLHYQPKVNLKTGAVIGAEALSRWNHPTHGTIPPGQFIPIAEKSGLILHIGAWVFGEACSQARSWADVSKPAKKMAVNVSGVQFQTEGFLEGLFAALNRAGLDPSFLELDVNEKVLMHHPERAAIVLKTLRDKGVQISVDNFGTGNSSLKSLQKLPLDALKIDRSFLRQITTVPRGTTVIGEFINMGRRLNLRVIAQGVETAEDLEFLWAHECDEAQGNFFSRPVPPDQLARLFQPKLNLRKMTAA